MQILTLKVRSLSSLSVSFVARLGGWVTSPAPPAKDARGTDGVLCGFSAFHILPGCTSWTAGHVLHQCRPMAFEQQPIGTRPFDPST